MIGTFEAELAAALRELPDEDLLRFVAGALEHPRVEPVRRRRRRAPRGAHKSGGGTSRAGVKAIASSPATESAPPRSPSPPSPPPPPPPAPPPVPAPRFELELGDGERRDDCYRYASCLGAFAKKQPTQGKKEPQQRARCPAGCAGFTPIPRHALIALGTIGGRSWVDAARSG